MYKCVMHCLIFTNILTYTTYKVEEHHDTINIGGVYKNMLDGSKDVKFHMWS